MACKMTGAEFKAFTTDDWGKGVFWDDYCIEVDGEELTVDYESITIADTAKVRILSGVVYTEGEYQGAQLAADTFARRWLKARDVVTVVLEIEKARLEGAMDAINQIIGVEVLK